MTERNYYIDFIKGITILQVILIHTVFFSGSSYIPDEIAQLTLFIDVPIFFFMSGWAYTYTKDVKKNNNNLIKIHYMYLIFMLIIGFILLFINPQLINLKNYLYWSVYIFPGDMVFNCISASMWFLPWFIIISFICTNILNNLSQYNIKNLLLGLAFISFYQSLSSNTNFNLQYLTVFSFFYILGYLSKDYIIKNKKVLLGLWVVLLLGIIIYGKTFDIPILKLQWHKMPPKFIYLLCSLFSIILIVYFKDKIKLSKNNYLVRIGKYSIYYYFAQGITSSLLYYVVPNLKVSNIVIKLLIAFSINTIIAIIIAQILKCIIPNVEKIICKLIYKIKGLVT